MGVLWLLQDVFPDLLLPPGHERRHQSVQHAAQALRGPVHHPEGNKSGVSAHSAVDFSFSGRSPICGDTCGERRGEEGSFGITTAAEGVMEMGLARQVEVVRRVAHGAWWF